MNMSGILLASCIAGSTAFAGSAPVVQHRLLPDAGVEGDDFGLAVDIDQQTVIVGATHWNRNGEWLPNIPAAYLFDAVTGEQIARLQAEDTAEEIFFAIDVALQGGRAFVGASDDVHDGDPHGSIYIFDSKTGAGLGKWTSSTGTPYEGFGFPIEATESFLAVGALGHDNFKGSVSLLDLNTGEELSRIVPEEVSDFSSFGFGLSVSESSLFARSFAGLAPGGVVLNASVYMYDITDPKNPSQRWMLTEEVFDSTLCIAMDQNLAVMLTRVAQPKGDGLGYVHVFDVLTGDELRVFAFSESDLQVSFNFLVELQDDIAYIAHSNTGELFTVNIETGVIIDRMQIKNAHSEQLGYGLAVDGDRLVAGATRANDNGINSGAAYVFSIGCIADFTGDGTLNFFDIAAFLTAFTANDPIADFNNDGRWNFFDVAQFLAAFSAGCP
ncbi:MAG: hypothetical protein JKX70_01050 [Phycisphaerales bacterium]|nr:hypothetical protein [Phycisphaerales bacterium]